MCMHAWAPHQPDAGPLNNRLSLLAASPSLRLLIWDLYYFIKHSFSLCMHVCGSVYFLACSWLIALALAITWGLNIINTIKSRLESLFIVGWGQCLWQLKAQLYWKELHSLSRVYPRPLLVPYLCQREYASCLLRVLRVRPLSTNQLL